MMIIRVITDASTAYEKALIRRSANDILRTVFAFNHKLAINYF